MTRNLSALLLSFTLLTSVASAQLGPGYFYPYNYQPFVPAISPYVPYHYGPTFQPWLRAPHFPTIGVVTNSIAVVNPWGQQFTVSRSYVVPYYGYGYWGNPYFSPFGYGYNPYDSFQNFNAPQVQRFDREPARFVFNGPDSALNPASGSQLQRGANYDGAFPRIPGTGSFTAFGAFIPGSGIYVNPLTGDEYNPGSGPIVRR